MSPGRRERGRTLTFDRAHADNGRVSGLRHAFVRILPRRLRGEHGQAMVEFALIAPLFIAIVVGIIQFGVALNFWLDMQRIANQGARAAVVNSWQTCPRTSANTLATHAADGCTQTLQDYLASQRGANGEDLNINICFPNGTSQVGDPVKVTVSQRFRFMQIVPVMPSINIGASSTQRIEQAPGRYAGTACP